MSYSFNLIEQAWIPCIGMNNRIGELSLRQTLVHAGRVRGIAGDSPLESAAIYRLLLAILHSALRGPEDGKAWKSLWQAGTWDTSWLHDYLDMWKHRFDLFDLERPFYQSVDGQLKQKSVINVVMDMASGNNAVFFDHHTEASGATLSAAQAARLATTVQTFGLAGLCDPQQKLTFTDAPWARGVIFLVEGDNLYETLALNLLRYDGEYPKPFGGEDDDCPAWESNNPYLPHRDTPQGYLDYLTWQNRRLLLFPEGDQAKPIVKSVSVSPGLRLSNILLDPMKHYRRDEIYGNLVLRFSEERALWRDSAALFHVHNPEKARPPLNFEETARRFEGEGKNRWLRLMALGMANDQAKIEFFREEHFPLPIKYLENTEFVGKLAEALQLAEEIRFKLSSASCWLALLVQSPKSDGKKWKEVDKISQKQAVGLCGHWGIERDYWGELELPFLDLLKDIPDRPNEALNAWQEGLQRIAWQTLEQAAKMAGETPAALKAAVRARTILGGALKELFPEIQKKEVPG